MSASTRNAGCPSCGGALHLDADAGQASQPVALTLQDCPDELTHRKSIELTRHGQSKDEAEKVARQYLDKNIQKLLEEPNCSSIMCPPSCEYVCEGGQCLFDYYVTKVTAEELRAPGHTKLYHKDVDGMWTFTFDVWWGCFCIQPD